MKASGLALERKKLIKSLFPEACVLTPAGAAYDTGLKDQILHQGGITNSKKTCHDAPISTSAICRPPRSRPASAPVTLTATRVVENSLARIAEINPKLNCFCFVYPDEARAHRGGTAIARPRPGTSAARCMACPSPSRI